MPMKAVELWNMSFPRKNNATFTLLAPMEHIVQRALWQAARLAKPEAQVRCVSDESQQVFNYGSLFSPSALL
eukprot:1035140-Pelagomonas_calceolata.AAC.6